ncbi:PREDICTED: epidermal growth factor receptor kinase substrate 8-like protein 3 [Corvus brachyrhynchos]|uniref:epidermal growth factor receptor kinase substrate 8-like protein 3 n=1 Tax=Corvus brachyrhynchos TaxID=85066 RepID=UPI0008164A97|nr:PREDICTED: epidermal growth factor receptor kinase substrate 8-like protein 3 [Corvus brachyrhynchos]
MGDPFGRWSNAPSRGEYDDRSPLRHSNSFVRLTGKSIYNQRKDYGQTVLKLQSDFQHHVEHLLTMHLERDLRSAEDCLRRLKGLEEQGRIWGQDVILEVKDQELVLRDVESKVPPGQGTPKPLWPFPPHRTFWLCDPTKPGTPAARVPPESWYPPSKAPQSPALLSQATPHARSPQSHLHPFNPFLAIRVGGLSTPFSPFQEELETFPLGSVQGCSTGLDNTVLAVSVQERNPPGTSVLLFQCERLGGGPEGGKNGGQPPRNGALMAGGPCQAETLRSSLGKGWDRGAPWGWGGSAGTPFPHTQGRTHRYVKDPDPSQLLRLIFSSLSFVLDHCPSPGLAQAVEAPLLLPEALEFLEETLSDDDYGVWKSLGTAWNRSRAEYPNSARVPAYVPVFSDGWLPPVLEQERHGALQDTPPPASVSPTHLRRPSLSLPPAQSPGTGWRDNPSQVPPLSAQGLVRALYDFQARNSQELSVRKGDTLQVLDQQRKWGLVQDEWGDRGHVPGNILEPLPEPGHDGGHGARSAPGTEPPRPRCPQHVPAPRLPGWSTLGAVGLAG